MCELTAHLHARHLAPREAYLQSFENFKGAVKECGLTAHLDARLLAPRKRIKWLARREAYLQSLENFKGAVKELLLQGERAIRAVETVPWLFARAEVVPTVIVDVQRIEHCEAEALENLPQEGAHSDPTVPSRLAASGHANFARRGVVDADVVLHRLQRFCARGAAEEVLENLEIFAPVVTEVLQVLRIIAITDIKNGADAVVGA